jgi:hypothetical protein
MISWLDIAGIVFACTTANHLGLVSAVERVIKAKLWIIDCPKCLTFWVTLVYCCYDMATHSTAGETAGTTAITVLAISFLASYAAIWVELFEGYIDTIYSKAYEKIYATADDDTVAADADKSRADSPVSDVRKGCNHAAESNK